eukprot:gene14704-19459_t
MGAYHLLDARAEYKMGKHSVFVDVNNITATKYTEAGFVPMPGRWVWGGFLDTSIEYLKGIGPQKADTLKKELGIFTYGDLLNHFPFRYVDRSHIYKIGELKGDFAHIQVKGRFSSFTTEGEKQAKRLKALFTDGTGFMEVVWFKGINWIEKYVRPGKEYVLFGKPNEFMGKLNIVHPELEDASEFLAEGNAGFQP